MSQFVAARLSLCWLTFVCLGLSLLVSVFLFLSMLISACTGPPRPVRACLVLSGFSGFVWASLNLTGLFEYVSACLRLPSPVWRCQCLSGLLWVLIGLSGLNVCLNLGQSWKKFVKVLTPLVLKWPQCYIVKFLMVCLKSSF
jgi:hypothetical protein